MKFPCDFEIRNLEGGLATTLSSCYRIDCRGEEDNKNISNELKEVSRGQLIYICGTVSMNSRHPKLPLYKTRRSLKRCPSPPWGYFCIQIRDNVVMSHMLCIYRCTCPIRWQPSNLKQRSKSQGQYRKSLSFASCTTHSRPSFRFFPVIALHGRIVHLCVLIESS